MDPLKIVGIVIAVVVLAMAGHASFGKLGAAIGLLIGAVLAFGVVGLLRTPTNERGTFDPVPDVEHDHPPKAPS